MLREMGYGKLLKATEAERMEGMLLFAFNGSRLRFRMT